MTSKGHQTQEKSPHQEKQRLKQGLQKIGSVRNRGCQKQRNLQIKIIIKTPKELREDIASINFLKVVYYEKQKEPLEIKSNHQC